MEIDLAAEHLERRLEQDDGRGAIHVIVAIDEDGLLAGNGRLYPRDCRGHALHGIRIEQVFDAGMKKDIRFGGSCAPRALPAVRRR